ncbi:MAG: 2,3-bisphosphoglycerate-independent phosphoglycerate mutase, partial [Oscillospiraceae bacterium]|nr:2,3-bisphosphoglycerate-independent phosphoglycerate mutase [Oscillospiraceae bacterium]
MKYIIVIGDGMADEPVERLGGKTPLEAARIPVMDALARAGVTGLARTVPEGSPPGSDTAILSIFGCDPREYYSGRSPLEAAGAGIELSGGDCSYRCNMITLDGADGAEFGQRRILSHSGGSVDGGSALELMRFLMSDGRFSGIAAQNGITFYPMPSFRHIAVQTGADISGLRTAPPHDHLGETAGGLLPSGCGVARGLSELTEIANRLLDTHPVNQKRRAAGQLPANGIWFWAQGTAIELPKLRDTRGVSGFVVSAVPLVWGIGALTGLGAVKLPGATGELDTDYEGKADAALRGLAEGADLAVVHIEAPDECTHNGDLDGKIEAIERIDGRCVARLKAGMDAAGGPYRLLILSDHRTLT